MNTIYKYPLQIEDRQVVEMPKNARILSIQVQNGVPCIWAKVNPKSEKEKRVIYIVGTGHDLENFISDFCNYCGTFQIRGGALVFHAFEISEARENILLKTLKSSGTDRAGYNAID